MMISNSSLYLFIFGVCGGDILYLNFSLRTHLLEKWNARERLQKWVDNHAAKVEAVWNRIRKVILLWESEF